MSELLFKKGLEGNLPAQEERSVDTFYITTDSKKIHLGDAVWEDTETVKEEIYSVIRDNEKTIAAALTELHDDKLGTEEFKSEQDKINSQFNNFYTKNEIDDAIADAVEGVTNGELTNYYDKTTIDNKLSEKVNATNIKTLAGQSLLVSGDVTNIDVKTINGVSIFGQGNIGIDLSLFKVVEELPSENFDSTKIYITPAASSEDDANIFIEYVYVEGKWEKIGEYKSDVDLTAYATTEYVDGAITTLTNEVLKNETTVAAALTKLHSEKLDVSAYTENQTTLEEELGNFQTALDNINEALEEKIDATILDEKLADYALLQDLLDDEEAIAAALTDLHTNKLDVSAYTLNNDALSERVSAVEDSINTAISESLEEINAKLNDYVLNDDFEELSGIVTANESAFIEALNQLKEGKLDASAYTDVRTVLSELDASGLSVNGQFVNVSVTQTDGLITSVSVDDEGVLSAFTEISQIILDNELTTAAALTELNLVKADKSAIPSLLGYATEEWVEAQGYLTKIGSEYVTTDILNNALTPYASAESVNSLTTIVEENKGAIDSLNEQISSKVDASAITEITESFATVEDVETLQNEVLSNEVTIAAALTQLHEGKLDVSAISEYSTIEYVDGQFEELKSNIIDNEVIVATAINELKETKISKLDLPSFDQFATKEDLSNIDVTDQLDNYVPLADYNALLTRVSQLETELASLKTEVNENEEVTAATLSKLNQEKADKPVAATHITVEDAAGVFQGATLEEILLELYNRINQ